MAPVNQHVVDVETKIIVAENVRHLKDNGNACTRIISARCFITFNNAGYYHRSLGFWVSSVLCCNEAPMIRYLPKRQCPAGNFLQCLIRPKPCVLEIDTGCQAVDTPSSARIILWDGASVVLYVWIRNTAPNLLPELSHVYCAICWQSCWIMRWCLRIEILRCFSPW